MLRPDLMAVASLLGGQRLRMADYVVGTGTPRGHPLPEGTSVDFYEAAGCVNS